MYKTIRHGENSLQYTILPQNDDFRIDGKLSSAESSCSSGRKSKTKRPRRRSFFAYLGLIFVVIVIVGAVLIPFLVSTECLPNPTEWFLGKNIQNGNEKAATGTVSKVHNGNNAVHSNVMGNGINIGKTVKIINEAGIEKVILKVNKTNENTLGNLKTVAISNNPNNETKARSNDKKANIIENETFRTTANGQVISKDLNANNQNEASEKQIQSNFDDQNNQKLNKNFIVNLPNEKQQQQQQQEQHFVTEVRFEPIETASSKPPGIIPTIVVTTLRNQYINKEPSNQQQQQPIVQSQIAPNIRPTTTFSSSASTASNGSNSSMISSTSSLMTRIIQVPLLKSAGKKPIVPPVLVKTNSQFTKKEDVLMATSAAAPLSEQGVNLNNIKPVQPIVESPRNIDWLHAHWPFVDPSTYFQWTGFKTEDSVLLPALLGFALIGMILIITVCLVARNKRTIVSSVRKRNRNVSDVEANGAEDNTTLLTTTNLSDED